MSSEAQHKPAWAVALPAVLLSCSALAVTAPWGPTGPPGGIVKALAADPLEPGIVFAGTDGGGVFRSGDGGRHWVAMNEGLTDLSVTALAVDPVHPATVYAGTGSHGAFKSTDGGATWGAINTGLPRGDSLSAIGALAVDPVNAENVYLGFSYSGGGVFSSGDGGSTWTAVGSDLSGSLLIFALTIDAAAPLTVYAGTSDGAWKTTDGGATWHQLDPSDLAFASVVGVAVPPAASDTVYLADSTQVWKSGDGGEHFTLLPALPRRATTSSARGILASPLTGSDAASFFVGVLTVFLISHGVLPEMVVTAALLPALAGAGWHLVPGAAATTASASGIEREIRPLSEQAPAVNNIRTTERDLALPRPTPAPGSATDASATPALVVATDGGVFATDDDGVNWVRLANGLDPQETLTLEEVEGNPPNLLVGTRGSGAFMTGDGSAWTNASSGLVASQVAAFAFLGQRTVLAAVRGGGVARSTNGGVTWVFANRGGLDDAYVAAFATAPETPTRVWAASDRGLFRSDDGGASWLHLPSGIDSDFVNAVVVDPTDPDTVYAGGSGGVRRSFDGGATWEDASSGMGNQLVECMASDPNTPQNLWAGAYGSGIFKSVDGAVSWEAANGGQGFLATGVPYAIAVDPHDSKTVYATVDSRAVWKTTDGGDHWNLMANGLLDGSTFAYATVRALGIDPTDSETIYAAAGGSNFSSVQAPLGVFASSDGGAHWAPFGVGLDGVPALAVAVDPRFSATTFAGTAGLGAFRIGPLPGFVPRRHLSRVP
jgi:photosystem II stability/assembly factor-like uncharacterized protein